MLKLKKIATSVLVFFIAFLFSGCGCKPKVFQAPYKITLEIWGLYDSSELYKNIIVNYIKMNPQIKDIVYKKLDGGTYKQEIIDSFAKDQGPDIFLINNTWIYQFKDLIAPAPKKNGKIKPIINEKKLREDFVDVVASDFLIDGEIFGLPLSVDSLGLYYNKDLFNEAGITLPPNNWDDFTKYAEMLTKRDVNNQIYQSGAAIGTAYNINRSSDILALLMIQGGAEMNEGHKANFSKEVRLGNSKNYTNPAESALNFYTQFATTSWKAYSWNPLLHYSLDLFIEGKLAMMLNYSWQMEAIRSRSPKLNFAVAPVPQLTEGIKANYANYWSYVVANKHDIKAKEKIKNEERIAEAWKFLTYLTSNPRGNINVFATNTLSSIDASFDPAQTYLNATKKPTGRRDIIDQQRNDADLGAFAEGNILAKSWRQMNPEMVESVFAEMIDSVNKGQFRPRDAVGAAAGKINSSIKK